jgi:2',3'-cyclic-nucleotide 2'-phosphodiesterase (5'-nucleotidase family)
MQRALAGRVLSVALCCSAGLFAWTGCRKTDVPPRLPEAPSVRLYFISSLAGALEPCGCRKDMLGGIDHAAALLSSRATEAPRHLLLATGPLFFQNPELDAERRDQDQWKAEALAAALGELQLAAWSPGVNDFAQGNALLLQLTRATGAKLLAANLHPAASALPLVGTALFQLGDYRVGVAGIGAAPPGIDAANDRAQSLAEAAQQLDAAGAQIRVALISATRGDGLRLAEKVTGFDVIALGKAADEGDANDAPFPPTLVGETLVLQAPNHLQALAYVDLFVVGNSFVFDDGSGIALGERRESLNSRLQELTRRKQRSAAGAGNSQQDRELENELGRLQAQSEALARQSAEAAKTRGSSFRYQLVEVREAAGKDPEIAKLMSQYYRRVNEHNREALRDRLPPPLPSGSSGYVGQAVCASCHAEEDAFWHGTQHATAYKTLSDQFKEFNLDCVGCHVTGYNRPGGSTVTHMQTLQNVQCEACHGPGSRHAEASGDTDFITRSPDANVCRGCHHTPHVADDWNAKEAWQHIIGPGHGQAAEAKETEKP